MGSCTSTTIQGSSVMDPQAEQKIINSTDYRHLRSVVLGNSSRNARHHSATTTSKFPEEFQLQRDAMLASIKKDDFSLRFISRALTNDRDFMFAIVDRFGYTFLAYASDKLKNDRDFILSVVDKNGEAIQYASRDLKADKQIVLAAIKGYDFALKYASENLKMDAEIALTAVKKHGWALRYASEEIKCDRDIVLAAINQYGKALKYASEELRRDIEIVMAAFNQDGEAFQYASEELRRDRDIVVAVVNQFGRALRYASEDLRADKEVILAAVTQDGNALEYASWYDRDIILAAIKQTSDAIKFIDVDMRKDAEMLSIFDCKRRILCELKEHSFISGPDIPQTFLEAISLAAINLSDRSFASIDYGTQNQELRALKGVSESFLLRNGVLLSRNVVHLLKHEYEGRKLLLEWVKQKEMKERILALVKFDRTILEVHGFRNCRKHPEVEEVIRVALCSS